MRFASDESGSTPFALLWFCVMTLIGGVGLDSANAWRNLQLLRQTADAAAHAGTVALATGASEASARAVVTGVIEANLDPEVHGPLLSGEDDIRLLHYDVRSATLSDEGRANAVSVTLHRDASTQNPVDLILLRLAAAFGDDLGAWNVAASSLAVASRSAICAGSDTIHARGQVHLTANQRVGPGYCVHSQEVVWMPHGSTFEPGSVVSMPDLEACGNKCQDSANPGTTEAARELNMPAPDITGWIEATAADLRSGAGALHAAFFADRPVAGDLTPLVQAGLVGSAPRAGTVVRLSPADFAALGVPPEGLTYHVSCRGLLSNLIAALKGKPVREVLLSGHYENLALLTDCDVEVAREAELAGVLLVMTDPGTRLGAASHAVVGDSLGGCDPARRSVLMTRGEIKVPAAFAGSNLTMLAAGDIHLSGASSHGGTHRGLSLISEGEIHVSAAHAFRTCGTDPALQPEVRLIRHVEAALP